MSKNIFSKNNERLFSLILKEKYPNINELRKDACGFYLTECEIITLAKDYFYRLGYELYSGKSRIDNLYECSIEKYIPFRNSTEWELEERFTKRYFEDDDSEYNTIIKACNWILDNATS